MIGILIAVLLAALVYFLCMALGLPAIVAIIAAILVLLAGIPTGGYGIGSRFGGGTGSEHGDRRTAALRAVVEAAARARPSCSSTSRRPSSASRPTR